MSSPRALLLLSLAVNVALGVVWWTSAKAAPRPAMAVVPAATHRPLVSRSALSAEAWKSVDATDDRTFVARLRAQGFPPAVVRALIRLRVRQRYADRLRALREAKTAPYWRSSPWADGRDAKTRAAQRELDRQMAADVRALLGSDADVASGVERLERKRRYGDLAPNKVEQVVAIDSDYAEMAARIRDEAHGILLPEDSNAITYLEQQRRADLARVLTPDELHEYDLRSSATAMEVQSRLANFHPTEAEYRMIADLQLAFDEQYGTDNVSSAADKTRRDALPALDAQIKAALGPDRALDFAVTTDGSYRAVQMLATTSHLAEGTAFDLVKLKIDTTQRANAIRQDSTLSPEARDAQLAALVQQAKNQVLLKIGASALGPYQRASGDWLSHLQPQAKAPAGPK